jgi:hypothetical protein
MMVITADPVGGLERKVRERLRNDESHRCLSVALTEVALAAIHPARHLGVGRSESRGMLEDSIESATQAAVETLITRLEDLVESLPQGTVRELASEQVIAERGLE